MSPYRKQLEDDFSDSEAHRVAAEKNCLRASMRLNYYELGQYQSRNGTIHRPPAIFPEPGAEEAWNKGVEEECAKMREAAGKIPLLFEDEKNNPHGD